MQHLRSNIIRFLCKSIPCISSQVLQEPTQKPKMGAEKVSMNIVVVGQVQSAKAINTISKTSPAASQIMNC